MQLSRRLITLNWPIEMALKSLEDDRETVSLPHTEHVFTIVESCYKISKKETFQCKKDSENCRLFHELGFLRFGFEADEKCMRKGKQLLLSCVGVSNAISL